jgi:hypothetical protein
MTDENAKGYPSVQIKKQQACQHSATNAQWKDVKVRVR